MERHQSGASLFLAVGLSSLLILIGTTASAADAAGAKPDNTPAILASLDARDATPLDDRAAGAIRGQGSEYRYVLVKILGLNSLDFGAGLEWTWNPFGYRYGAWGGPGWTNGGLPGDSVVPADASGPDEEDLHAQSCPM